MASDHLPLITGCRGRLGRALTEVIETEFVEEYPSAIFSTRDELDISDYFRLSAEFERIRPTVIINCAAYAAVDSCETRRELATSINDDGARNVARAASQIGARVIQVSTDLVFDGAQEEPYREEDEPNPLSWYAATKLAGEQAVAEENADHTILRSSWFFGPWPSDRYPEVFLEALGRGKPIRIVADRIGSPTYLRDLARALAILIDVPYKGLLHFANRGEPTSRYHLLVAMAERLGIPTTTLFPISSAEWTEDLAKRPSFSALDPTRFEQITGYESQTWMESLEEYAAERDA